MKAAYQRQPVEVGVHRAGVRRRLWTGASLLLFAGGIALAFTQPALSALTGLALVGSLIGRNSVHKNPGGRPTELGSFVVEDSVIAVEAGAESYHYNQENVAVGWLEDNAQSAVLQIRDGTVLTVRCRSQADARQILKEAGVPDQRAERMTVRRASDGFSSMVGCLTSVVGAAALSTLLTGILTVLAGKKTVGGLIFVAIGLALCAATWRYWVGVLPTKIFAGSDGIQLRRPLRRTLFVPFDGFEGVSLREGEVAIRHTTGITSFHGNEEIVDQIRRAHQRRADAPTALDLARLDRGGRDLESWCTALQLILQGGQYRDQAIDVMSLVELVEDAHAPVERRIAAACALSQAEDEAVKKRIEVAARACADTPLRFAIEQAAEGELEQSVIDEADRHRSL